MKIYKTEIVPATTREVCAGRECDICGEMSHGDEWDHRIYRVEHSQVECERGSRYPDSENVRRYEVDICPECFESKLIPWVNEQRMGKPPIKAILSFY